jgi:hypothetical protein
MIGEAAGEVAVAEVVTETPSERAARRVEELRRAASSVLEVLAQIYLDEDWRYLSDEAGQPFTGFTAFVQQTLGGSASNARRYRQGVETLVVPLRQLTANGAHIPVTPNDVVRLGRSGAKAVVEAAPETLAGISESSEQTVALRRLLNQVIDAQVDLGRIADHGVPEIPAVVPPAALLAAGAADGDTPSESIDPAAGWYPPVGDISGNPDPWGPDPGGDECGLDTTAAHRGTDRDTEHPASPDDGSAGARGRGHGGGGLRVVLDDVLGLDPSAVTADAAGRGAALAADCLAAAQRLARIAQLLKTFG